MSNVWFIRAGLVGLAAAAVMALRAREAGLSLNSRGALGIAWLVSIAGFALAITAAVMSAAIT